LAGQAEGRRQRPRGRNGQLGRPMGRSSVWPRGAEEQGGGKGWVMGLLPGRLCVPTGMRRLTSVILSPEMSHKFPPVSVSLCVMISKTLFQLVQSALLLLGGWFCWKHRLMGLPCSPKSTHPYPRHFKPVPHCCTLRTDRQDSGPGE
jgi:hypothetical protein